jgi:putative tricarboxylic transport membrane protein
MLEQLMMGLQTALHPSNLLAIAAGTALGVLVGAMPGLSASAGLACVLPLTFVMGPIPAMLMMTAIYLAAEYGGSITAITLGIPGSPASFPTTFDGYPLTKKGQTGKALGISIVSSTLGGALGTIVLIFAAGPVSKFALKFGPAEYFALAVFGLSIVSSLAREGVLKGFISAVIGLLVAMVGVDVLSGYPRFSFGLMGLYGGIRLAPCLIGLFAITEVFRMVEESGAPRAILGKVSASLPTWQDLKGCAVTILRSSLIGTAVGSVPGSGAAVASMISYNEAKRASKHPELFGTGILEGVSAAEAAANASVGGAMIPLLTLGVPASPSDAILLGALILHNVDPGPLLMTKHPELVYSIYAGFFIAECFMFVIGMLGIPLWVKLISLPSRWLMPVVLGIAICGAYGVGNSLFDVGIAVFFGVLGYLMRRFGFSIVASLFGVILGSLLESNYRRALAISGGDYTTFLTHPISLMLLLFALTSFFLPAIRSYLGKRREVRNA